MSTVVIDGNNYTLIGYSTLIGRDIEDIETALYGRLSQMISKLRKEFGNVNYYVVWDTYGGTDYRKTIDPNYKSTRNHSAFDYQTVENCKTAYENYDIKSISIPQCEGDDGILSLCKVIKELHPEEQVTIVTRDHDMIQVVQRGYADNIYDPTKKTMMEIPWYDIVQYKSLVGDPADNIKGVKGIGPKAAIKVITGQMQLTEQQNIQYELARKVVDGLANPNFETNNEYIRKLMENK